ncbi:MAG: glycosyltransferase [Eubacteriales bacterium]
MKNSVILIPSYKPDEYLVRTVKSTLDAGFKDIVVIDDGSGSKYDKYFSEVKNLGAYVIRHSVNLGKGRAMKTAFNTILQEYPKMYGVIVCDADGQHPIDFVIKIDELMSKNPSSLILGVREFSKAKIPLPNLLGNTITRLVFFLLTGMRFSDTQCGLRGYPKKVIEKLLSVSGERYEYENEMLLECRKSDIPIVEIAMDAVYLGENGVSHFNRVLDSARIYRCILRFATLPFVAGVISLVVFILLPKENVLATLIQAMISVGIGYIIMFIPGRKKLLGAFLASLFTAMFGGFMLLFSYLFPIMNPLWQFLLSSIPMIAISYSSFVLKKYGQKPCVIKF